MTYDELLAHPRLERVRRSGRGQVARCPVHSDHKPSLSITQAGDRILVHCFAGCSVYEICDALGIQVADLFTDTNTSALDDTARRRAYARKLWDGSKSARGTAVVDYLNARGITMSPLPLAIRYTTVSVDDYPRTMVWPGMIAGIQDANGVFAGVSITALAADGSDKAPTETPRRIYGPYSGGAVRLSNRLDTRIALCEGLETGLSIAQACPELPVWCTLSASNLPHAAIPSSVRTVIIAADGDAVGEIAALKAAVRLRREGRRVRIARPPTGMDFNHVLMEGNR